MKTEITIGKDTYSLNQELWIVRKPSFVEVHGFKELKRKSKEENFYFALNIDEAKEIRDFLIQLNLDDEK